MAPSEREGEQRLRVAFVGDTGAHEDGEASAGALFAMMARQGVQLVLHNGDLGYDRGPREFEQFLDAHASGMEVLAASGNHDASVDFGGGWFGPGGFQELMARRQGREIPALRCSGDYGERYSCVLGEHHIVLIGWAETDGREAVAASVKFLDDAFSGSPALWRWAVWHKPTGRINPGDVHTGLDALTPLYEAARKHGAVITSGHSHVYGRTKLIRSFGDAEIEVGGASGQEHEISCGRTIAVVAGMGGYRLNGAGPHYGRPYWRRKLTSDSFQGDDLKAGALICDVRGAGAACEFRLSTGEVMDTFALSRRATDCCSDRHPSGLHFEDGSLANCVALSDEHCVAHDFVRYACPQICGACGTGDGAYSAPHLLPFPTAAPRRAPWLFAALLALVLVAVLVLVLPQSRRRKSAKPSAPAWAVLPSRSRAAGAAASALGHQRRPSRAMRLI